MERYFQSLENKPLCQTRKIDINQEKNQYRFFSCEEGYNIYNLLNCDMVQSFYKFLRKRAKSLCLNLKFVIYNSYTSKIKNI